LISVAVCDRAFTAVGRSDETTPDYLSKRLGLCSTSGIVFRLGLSYLSWPCIHVMSRLTPGPLKR